MENDVGREAAAVQPIYFRAYRGCDAVGGGFGPVVGHGVPCDGSKTEFAGGAEDIGAACAKGWAEEADGLACDLFECVIGGAEFFADFAWGGVREIWMRPGVITDYMTAAGDELGESGLLAGVFADQEESGFHAVAIEDFEQARRKGGVGAVVKGEGDFAGFVRGGERTAKDLRGGPERCVIVAADGEAGG